MYTSTSILFINIVKCSNSSIASWLYWILANTQSPRVQAAADISLRLSRHAQPVPLSTAGTWTCPPVQYKWWSLLTCVMFVAGCSPLVHHVLKDLWWSSAEASLPVLLFHLVSLQKLHGVSVFRGISFNYKSCACLPREQCTIIGRWRWIVISRSSIFKHKRWALFLSRYAGSRVEPMPPS